MSDLLLPHRLPGPPITATLLERENRFLARCLLPSGEEVHAHVPDRGRLIELLVPGARVLLFSALPRSTGNGSTVSGSPTRKAPTRKTAWSLLAAWDPTSDVLVAIDPAGAATRMRPILERGLLPAVGEGWSVRPEVKLGSSRIDFLLTRQDEPDEPPLFIEVKNVGVVRHGVALFPDAPTERGTRHLLELERFVKEGKGRAMVLFVAQRADAEVVSPHREIDPTFAETLKKVSSCVELAAVRFEVTPEGCLYRGPLPVAVNASEADATLGVGGTRVG